MFPKWMKIKAGRHNILCFCSKDQTTFTSRKTKQILKGHQLTSMEWRTRQNKLQLFIKKELFHSGLLLPHDHIPRNVSAAGHWFLQDHLQLLRSLPSAFGTVFKLLTLDFGMKRKMQSTFSKHLSCTNFAKNGTQRLEILLIESCISLSWKVPLKIIQSNPSATS